jgi:UDP-N-acetylmuramate dehydrogenase
VIEAVERRRIEALLGEGAAFDEPLARHTSLRIGGPADALARPSDRTQLAELLSLADDAGIPVCFLGKGFNLLVRDGGVDGIVIQLSRLRAIACEGDDAIRAEVGVSHSQVTRFCSEHGLAGLEFAAGIPGSVGGWLAMNAGIGEREMVHVVREAEVVGPGAEPLRRVQRDALQFVYRAVEGLPPGTAFVSGLFEVTPSTPEAVRERVEQLLARRSASQPLDVPSCGSVFKNPPGDHAGRLIEAAGLKGERIGGAEISSVHANFIANRGGASAADVLALIELARRRIADATGIELETEVHVIGRNA